MDATVPEIDLYKNSGQLIERDYSLSHPGALSCAISNRGSWSSYTLESLWCATRVWDGTVLASAKGMKDKLDAMWQRWGHLLVDVAFAAGVSFLFVYRPGTLLYHAVLTALLLATVWISYRDSLLGGMFRAALAGGALMLQGLMAAEPDVEQAAAAAAFVATAGIAGALADRERNDLERLRRASQTVVQSSRRLEESYLSTLQTLSAALDARDHDTAGHSERVAAYAVDIGRALGLSAPDLESVRRAARLHDIGKIGIRDAVLLNGAGLSYIEAKEMQRHPRIGAELLASLEFLEPSLPLITHHHECFDGTGYPDGLSGEQIPLGARIIAVADAFDAMTTKRPYQGILSPDEAVEVLRQRSGSQFDRRVVEVFVELYEAWKQDLPSQPSHRDGTRLALSRESAPADSAAV